MAENLIAAIEPAVTLPRHRTHAATAILILGCCTRSEAPTELAPQTSQHAKPLAYRLLGHRDFAFTKDGPARVFDTHHPAVLITDNPSPALAVRLVLSKRNIPLEVTTSTAAASKIQRTLKPPTGTLGDGHLIVKTGIKTVLQQTVRYARAPEDHPNIAEARRLRKSKDFDRAEALLRPVLTSTDAWISFWGHLESGDVAFRRGDTQKALELWQLAARPPLVDQEPGRASERLRASAYVAMSTGLYREAESMLEAAAHLTARLEDFQGRARGSYYKALFRQLTGEQLAAGRAFRAAIKAARTASVALDVQRYEHTYAVHLISMGQFRSAFELMKGSPPLKQSRAIDRALFHWNFGWVRFSARAHGYALSSKGSPWQHYYDALEIIKRVGTPQRKAGVLGNMADQAIAERDYDKAQMFFGGMPDEKVNPLADGRWQIQFSKVQFAIETGALEKAQRQLFAMRPALDREFGDRPTEAGMRWAHLAGDLARLQGQKQTARKHYEVAFEVAQHLERSLAVPTAQSAARWRRGDLPAKLAALLVREGRAAEALWVLEYDRAAVVERLFQESYVSTRPELWRTYRDRRRDYERLQKRGCVHLIRASTRRACKSAIQQSQSRAQAALELVYEGALGSGESQRISKERLLAHLRQELGPQEALLYLARSRANAVAIWLTPDDVVGYADAESMEKLWPRLASKSHVFVVPSRAQNGADVFVNGFAGGGALAGATSLSFIPYGRVLERAVKLSAGQAIVLADPDGTLLEAGVEGGLVAKRLGAVQIPVPEPDKSAVLDLWRRSRVFHYAGHAEEFDGPWGTRLRLGRASAITLEDLLEVRPASHLAVLNACATGRSTAGATLPSVLLRSGTRSVLATVRVQRDGESSKFIGKFYDAGGDHRPGPAFLKAVLQSQTENDDAWKLFRLWGRP